MTRFWQRRICEAIILVVLPLLALYGWSLLRAGESSVSSAVLISPVVALLATLTLAAGIYFYLKTSETTRFRAAYIPYILLCITVAVVIHTTGNSLSPFIALWMIVGVFAGVFGSYGLIPLFVAVGAFLLTQLVGGVLTNEAVIVIAFAGELPLVVSYLIWHSKSTENQAEERAYLDLASELNQVANKSEVVINAIADGVIAISGNGIIQLINPAAQQILGWGKQDALALDYKSVFKLYDKEKNPVTANIDPIARVLAENKPQETDQLFILTNSEKRLSVSIHVSPVGQLGSGVIVVFRDITNEKAEEREQAEFISTASHEMRTPVASIEGYLGLALNEGTATIDARAREYINKAHDSAEHLGRLFQDLLDITKAEDGRLSNNPKIVELVAFTHDIIQGLASRAELKGLRMLFKPVPDNEPSSNRSISPVFYVYVDNDHLREIIGNLIENAIKYTPAGDVVVDITGNSETVTISVADSGIGIPKEDQAHLFQKFYRVDNSETREIGGTGLGLYLCRRLIETMNGRIWVESEYKKGSSFFIELPRTSHEDAMELIEAASLKPEIQLVQSERPIMQNTAYSSNAYTGDAASRVPAIETPEPRPFVMTPRTTQVPTPLSALPHVNTPLTAIEENPERYAQRQTDYSAIDPNNK